MLPVNTFLPCPFVAIELWIHQYRSVAPPVFLCYGRKWCDNICFSGGQVTEMRLHGDFETLEPEIDCSAVDTQRTNVSNARTRLILNGWQMHACAIRKQFMILFQR